MTLLLVLANTVHAAQPEFVSQTFKEIQSRVIRRDANSGAILEVKVKEDSPKLGFGLNFSIAEDAGDVVIVLSRNLKTGDGVYEKYRLRMDDALRQELQNQKKLKELLAAQEKKYREAQTKKIAELTGGQLKFGMSFTAVEAIKGKAPKGLFGAAEFGTFTWIYPDMKLRFVRESLNDVELTKQ